MKFGCCCLLILACASCDRSPANLPPAPPRVTVEVRPITPLLPRLMTHIAVDSRGNLYWNQESDPPVAGGDLTFAMGEGGVPQAVASLNVDHVLGTLNAAGGQGAVRSLAIGPDDALYALFVGSKGSTPIYTVLRYGTIDHKLTVAADTSRIMAASRLGPSLAVARGTLLGTRDNLWLWLRHSDGVALLKLTPSAGAFDARAFVCDPPNDAFKLRLSSDDEDLATGTAGDLYYLDRAGAACWHIAPDGKMARLMSLVGVSTRLTVPAAHDGSLFFLAPVGLRYGSVDLESASRPAPLARPEASEPILLQFTPATGNAKAWDRTLMDAPANLPLQDVQPRQLFWDDSTATLITFDAASGEILRLRFTGR